jgi:hypothetical protein
LNYESRRTLWSGDGGKWAVEVIRSDAEVKWANKSFSRAAAVARADKRRWGGDFTVTALHA